MKAFANLVFSLLLLNLVAACSSDNTTPPDNLSSHGTGSPGNGGDNANSPGVTLQGGDQGREGGHYLICSVDANIPDSRMPFEIKQDSGHDKAIFLDYFLEIKSQEDREALQRFYFDETDTVRLDRVTKRLLFIFDGNSEMKQKAQRLDTYVRSFMERKGEAQWIESNNLPHELELTEDITPEQLDDSDLQNVNDHCQARFFQAAIYDYSTPGQEIFYYSEFFEDNASRMQKSFRNVHEMLRFAMRDETPQVIALTAYFHTSEFFKASIEDVQRRIAEISEQTHRTVRFY